MISALLQSQEDTFFTMTFLYNRKVITELNVSGLVDVTAYIFI